MWLSLRSVSIQCFNKGPKSEVIAAFLHSHFLAHVENVSKIFTQIEKDVKQNSSINLVQPELDFLPHQGQGSFLSLDFLNIVLVRLTFSMRFDQ